MNVFGVPLTLPLEAAEATLDLVGGKGASLARMTAAGLPVPGAFLVTTAAYRRFVDSNDLQKAILEAASGAPIDGLRALERPSAAIQACFERAAMPEEIATAIGRAYGILAEDEPAVAVRSSATAEDLPGASFAGQQDTYLNVTGVAAVMEAVRRCWASLWTARAIGYRLRSDINQRSVEMAVVVQRMVPAEVAGVCFTANPTTGDRNELVINASYGLGEAVVSGRVTPDSFVLERPGLTLREAVVGEKKVMIVPADGQGTIARAVDADRRDKLTMSKQLLHELGKLAFQIEQVAGGVPQDIEWALAGGRFWLLQARPMTGRSC